MMYEGHVASPDLAGHLDLTAEQVPWVTVHTT